MTGLGRIHLIQTRDGPRKLTCERPFRADTNNAVDPDAGPLDRAPLRSSLKGAQRPIRQVHNGHACLTRSRQSTGVGRGLEQERAHSYATLCEERTRIEGVTPIVAATDKCDHALVDAVKLRQLCVDVVVLSARGDS